MELNIGQKSQFFAEKFGWEWEKGVNLHQFSWY